MSNTAVWKLVYSISIIYLLPTLLRFFVSTAFREAVFITILFTRKHYWPLGTDQFYASGIHKSGYFNLKGCPFPTRHRFCWLKDVWGVFTYVILSAQSNTMSNTVYSWSMVIKSTVKVNETVVTHYVRWRF